MERHLADIITCTKFQDDIFRGLQFYRVSNFPFSYWFLHGPYNSSATALRLIAGSCAHSRTAGLQVSLCAGLQDMDLDLSGNLSVPSIELENMAIIANALQLEAARRRAVPIRFNSSPTPSLKSLSLSVAVLERFYCWYMLRYDVTLNYDPVTLTFDLWPWTFVVCRLCHDQPLYQIWAQSGKPRRSYCSLNIWPYDQLNVLRYALL